MGLETGAKQVAALSDLLVPAHAARAGSAPWPTGKVPKSLAISPWISNVATGTNPIFSRNDMTRAVRQLQLALQPHAPQSRLKSSPASPAAPPFTSMAPA